jgi:phosphatidylserine synthase
MIDWVMVAANALWILGLAIGLATLSYASWEAWATHETFRQRLAKPAAQGVLALAGFLFCMGLAATSWVLWQTAVWLILGVLFLWQAWLAFRNRP